LVGSSTEENIPSKMNMHGLHRAPPSRGQHLKWLFEQLFYGNQHLGAAWRWEPAPIGLASGKRGQAVRGLVCNEMRIHWRDAEGKHW